MAVNDFRPIKSHYGVQRFRTQDTDTEGGTGTIAPGDLVKKGLTGGNFATIVLTGDPEVATDVLLGVVRKQSTETATADGVCDVEIVGPGTVLEGDAATAANIDTDAKLLLLLLDTVACDRSAATKAGVLTIDEDEGDDPNNHGLTILDGDIVKGTLRVGINLVSIFTNLTGQTMD